MPMVVACSGLSINPINWFICQTHPAAGHDSGKKIVKSDDSNNADCTKSHFIRSSHSQPYSLSVQICIF